jgi:hypothetical protein
VATPSQLPENDRLTYYAGFAWDRSGQVTNAQEWDRYLADFAKRTEAPSEAQMAAIANQTAPIARQALFFHFESRPRDIDLPDNSPEDTG